MLLTVMLIDASTGILKVMRAVTFSPEFTAAINHAVYEQSQRPWVGDMAYNRQVEAAYAKYPSVPAMVKAAKLTKGGE